VWYTDLSRAHVTQARGVLFNGIGHSTPRTTSGSSKVDQKVPKAHRRTELLPEETLYLIERGSLFCWKNEPSLRPRSSAEVAKADGEHDMCGSPMSVQQAFVEMIGREDLTLERYHVSRRSLSDPRLLAWGLLERRRMLT
jgi:tRNA-splicing endonuclease subunit Sen54